MESQETISKIGKVRVEKTLREPKVHPAHSTEGKKSEGGKEFGQDNTGVSSIAGTPSELLRVSLLTHWAHP